MPVATRRGAGEAKKAGKPADDHDACWHVVLFNCDCHTFDAVERVLIEAVRCSLAQARAYSWEIHSKGSVAVYHGALERCEAVADVIGRVGLQVKVSK